jgi:hypothetical protein
MVFDPFLLFIAGINYLITFHDRTQEWPQYEQVLREATAFLSDLDDDRQRLLSDKRIPGGVELIELGGEIKAGNLLLEKAKKLVGWNHETSNGQKTASIEFAARYSTAIRYQESLSECLLKLQEPRRKISLWKADISVRDAYLREERRRTCKGLAQQYIRWGTRCSTSRGTQPGPARTSRA